MNDIQTEVIEDIKIQAAQKGANAIIGFMLDFDNIGSKNKSMIMAFAKGTAVIIEKIE